MSRLKLLSGKEVVKIFQKFGFYQENQRGSHIKLTRVKKGSKQSLTIPCHKELSKGTIKAIFRQALRYIPEDDLREFFYSGDL